MSSPSVYVISSAGEVAHKLVVKGPEGTNWLASGLRVVANRLLVEFYHDCQRQTPYPYDEILALAKVEIGSCELRTLYTIVDATTGERIADFEPGPGASGPMACYVPDPDRFYTFSDAEHRVEMIEATPK